MAMDFLIFKPRTGADRQPEPTGVHMKPNPLVELSKFGQSFWYDNISRDLIESGQLKRMIDEDGLKGVTSNPSIFLKAIKEGGRYNDVLRQLISAAPSNSSAISPASSSASSPAGSPLSHKELLYELEMQDIAEAADIFKGVYEATGGKDGYVSIEVDPTYARDAEATVAEARQIFKRLDRKNIMIKVPATKEALPAIKRLIADGINVNVTLLFSVKRYVEVVDAYLGGLEERLADGKPIDHIASVASFFVSRLDTVVDKILSEKMHDVAVCEEHPSYEFLMGKAAVSNAKVAYQAMVANFSCERFINLKHNGASIQRLLWASTSTKNPGYRDVMYVEQLIGANTVNTIPPDTILAFKDHGKAARTVDQNMDETLSVIEDLPDLGINVEYIAAQLEQDGVKQFIDAFNALLDLMRVKQGI
jgi:transaldolase